MIELADIILKLSDLSTAEVTYFKDRLLVMKWCMWGNSWSYIYFYEEPELKNIWDGFAWNLVMVTDLVEQFDFREVM